MVKIERLPSYLSPSALMMAEKMPNTFFLTRLINDPIERDEQNLAAAVGSAFDYYIKMLLIEKKFPHKEKYLEELKKGIETNVTEAHTAGKKAFQIYANIYNPNEFNNVELQLHGSLDVGNKNNAIPIFGKLDATVIDIKRDPNKVLPFDWKVTGYTSKEGTSPCPGYYRLWEGIRPKAMHTNYYEDIPIETINENWATQLCTYGWLMDYKIGTPFYVRVDQLIWKNNTIRCIAQYRALVTPSFQDQVYYRYKRIWNLINSGEFIKLLASDDDENLIWISAQKENWW